MDIYLYSTTNIINPSRIIAIFYKKYTYRTKCPEVLPYSNFIAFAEIFTKHLFCAFYSVDNVDNPVHNYRLSTFELWKNV